MVKDLFPNTVVQHKILLDEKGLPLKGRIAFRWHDTNSNEFIGYGVYVRIDNYFEIKFWEFNVIREF